jgi:hypothetical protein
MDGPDLGRVESLDSTKMQTPSTMRMGVPRIDVEPLFTALKAATGEAWPEYKTTLNSFFLGTAFFTVSTNVTLTLSTQETSTRPNCPK